jgi:lipid-binding SYLF domain-containing protein
MKTKTTFAALLLLTFCAVIPTRADQSKSEVDMRLDSAASSLRQLAGAPDKGIPDEVYNSAKCIAVVPRMLKGAFIFGGEHGRGVATCKLPDGKWSAPALFSISGGSWGLQAGGQDIDLVMMVMTDRGVQHLLQNKFQIGAEASGAAGPVGATPPRASTGNLTPRFLRIRGPKACLPESTSTDRGSSTTSTRPKPFTRKTMAPANC